MKPFLIHADAEAELREALQHYEQQRVGLGREFRQEFEAALERVRQNPFLYAAEDESAARLCPLRRFPYTLVYLDLDDRIWIAAVAHQRRRPRFWARRRPG
ncbi:MAG: type II toxin-antitoxin system RelE/ParE family toxin [Gemmataceae bacterium]